MRTAVDLSFSPTAVSNSDVAGPAINIGQCYGYAIAAIVTGASLTGSIKLQASLDYSPQSGTGTWIDIANTSQSISGPANLIFNEDAQYYAYIRPFFVHGTNAGTVTYQVATKGP